MNDNFIWHCPKCTFYYCGKCCKIIKERQKSIFCNCCNKWIHYKCCGLDRNTFHQLGCSEDPWFCMDCIENNVPFFSLDNGRLCKLFGNNSVKNRNESVDTQGIPFCRVCARRSSYLSSAIKCEQCQHFIHKKCSKMSNNLNKITNYVCAECIAENIPFSHLENDEISELSYNSNFLCNCLDETIPEKGKNDLKFLNLKELNFKNDLSYIKVDPDENITDVTNFNYFTTHEFHKLSKKANEKNNSFSILHSNICSLQGNFDKLQLLSDNLDYKFDVIAITETWHTENSVLFHPGLIDGYHKYEGNTGSSKKGGCGFYVKDIVAFANRSDLDIKHKSNKSEFETKWIEVIGDMDKNIITGVVYSHPKSKDKDFYDYISKTLRVIKKEKKTAILCGDFNLNLLNFERNEEVNNFLNLLVSNGSLLKYLDQLEVQKVKENH